jgi:DNA-binding HxlR family transcriptional regulator
MERESTYRHFCTMARTLETVGDRWSLLIVRDLLPERRRFTDLQERLVGITPKWLTVRLRQLEEAGIVDRDQAIGRREVWYSLTDKGRELEPVVEALTLWGVKHRFEPPQPREAVHPEHILRGLVVALNAGAATSKAAVTWAFDFGADGVYTVGFDGKRWDWSIGAPPEPDVTVETTPAGWARFVALRPRKPAAREVKLHGRARAREQMLRLFGVTA